MWAGVAQARQVRGWEAVWEQGFLPPLPPAAAPGELSFGFAPPGRALGFCTQEAEPSSCAEDCGLQVIMVVMNGNGRPSRGSLSH